MLRRLLLAGLAAGVTLGPVGCRHCCKSRRATADADIPPPPGGFLGPPVAPGGGDRIPPPALPIAPSGGGSLPPPDISNSRGTYRIDPALPPSPPPAVAALPPLAPAPVSPPPAAPPYRSAKPPKELLLPDDASANPTTPPPASGKVIPPPDLPSLEEPVRPSESAKPSFPPPDKGAGSLPPAPATPNRSLPPAPANVPDRPPVGLTGYTAVADKPGVYAGRRPALDGFDALKTAGFRTVVYIHDPSADASAARELAEKRGLKFVPVPASPESLARAVSAFNAAVADKSNRPTYVCDEDGLRAGFLWYVHFRTVDLMNDDLARVRATALGLRDDGSEEAKRYWLAAQEYLSNR